MLLDKPKIAMCGCTRSSLEIAQKLLADQIDISYFVSLTEDQARTALVSDYRSLENISKEYNIPIYYPKTYSLKDPSDIKFFVDNKFDILLVMGWNRLIPQEILQTLKYGGIGVHGSSDFLPKGRGRSPINWSLIEGKSRFILQLFLLKAGIDDGEVLDWEIFDINQWDTCQTLYYKNEILTSRMLLRTMSKILNGTIQPISQKGSPTYYPKRTPEDGEIDWRKSVFEIYNFIRAITRPYPGAFSYLDNKKIFIWKAQPFDTRITYPDAQEGEIVEILSTGHYVVNCNSGLLLVTESEGGEIKVGKVFSVKSVAKS